MATGRKLTVPPGYDLRESPRMASFAAQLDDQLTLLKKNTAELDVSQLEWQPHSGMNTIGMLMAHLAVVDISGGCGSCRGRLPKPSMSASPASSSA
jgi:hypothetical protein